MIFHNKTAFKQFACIWILPFAIVCLSFLLQLFDKQEVLRYERLAVQQGSFWCLLTGNYVHLGWSHWVLNMVGLALIWLLFGSKVPILQWLYTFLLTSLLVGLGLYLYTPDIVWYVGLSGVLHGLFIVGLLMDCTETKVLKILLLGVLFIKLSWEQFSGALPGSVSMSGGAVVVDAHLYGAISGLLMVAIFKGCALLNVPSGSYSE